MYNNSCLAKKIIYGVCIMDNLKEAILKKRPNLADSSVVTYMSNLSNIYKNVFPNMNLQLKKFDTDYDKILNYNVKVYTNIPGSNAQDMTLKNFFDTGGNPNFFTNIKVWDYYTKIAQCKNENPILGTYFILPSIFSD